MRTVLVALRVLVLLVWWLGCEVDNGSSGPPGQRPPPELGPSDCDRLGGQWIPTTQARAGGFCRLGGGVLVLPELPDAGADAGADVGGAR